MWIITERGFISVVQDRDNPQRLIVRARVRRDLADLFKFADVKARIFSTPDADYQFRAWLTRGEMCKVLVACVSDLDYTNFKSAVAEVDVPRAHLLHEVWATLRKLVLQ